MLNDRWEFSIGIFCGNFSRSQNRISVKHNHKCANIDGSSQILVPFSDLIKKGFNNNFRWHCGFGTKGAIQFQVELTICFIYHRGKKKNYTKKISDLTSLTEKKEVTFDENLYVSRFSHSLSTLLFLKYIYFSLSQPRGMQTTN